MAAHKSRLSPSRRLGLQSIALLVTLGAPLLLYQAASHGAIAGVLLWLGVMAAGMALAMAVS